MTDRSVATYSTTPRAVVCSPHAVVAASQPLAVETGLEILRAGGSAADAAIAANAMLGLVEPMSCGLGGDLFAIVWDASTRRLYGLNGCGRSPLELSREEILRRGYESIPSRGPLSWSVPGCVDGWSVLHERFGRLPMDDLLRPTIETAIRGFEVTPVIARMWGDAVESLAADPGATAVYLPDGGAPKPGERFANPKLAETLAVLAAGGRDVFYLGSVMERLTAFSREMGGYFSRADFEQHTSTWVEPVSVPYKGYDVWQLPPNTQGLALLEMLRLLEPLNLSAMQHNSAMYVHHLVEAKKLAYEDRARFYADPDFADVPVAWLVSEEHASNLRSRLDPKRAAHEVVPDTVPGRRGDTVYLTVVDTAGNAVSLIQSIYRDFGSAVVPPDLGFAIQNRGCLFHLDPNHANAFRPGKRPFHTLMPGFVTRGGEPVFSFGVMGGDMQPQGQLQVFLNIVEFGMDVQLAGEALRCRHDGSSTPTGQVMRDGGTVKLERGFSDDVIEGLRSKGHRVETAEHGFGGYQGIWIDPETGVRSGGSEPRKDGLARGL